jgi:hypothetical protein
VPAILTQLVWEITLPTLAAEVKQIPAPSFNKDLSGMALAAGVSFLMWKMPIFRLLSENSFLDFFCVPDGASSPLDFCLPLSLDAVGWVTSALEPSEVRVASDKPGQEVPV